MKKSYLNFTILFISIISLISIYFGVYFLFGCNKGLDFTDETFYLIEANKASLHQSWFMPFGSFTNILWKLSIYRIDVFRANSIFFLFISGGTFSHVFIKKYLHSINTNKFIHIYLILIGGFTSLFFYKAYVRIPGYNYLSYISFLWGVMAIWKISDTSSLSKSNLLHFIIWNIILSTAILISLSSRPLTGIFLLFYLTITLILFNKKNIHYLIYFSISIILTIILLHSIRIFDFFYFKDRLLGLFNGPAYGSGSHSPTTNLMEIMRFPIKFFKDLFEFGITYYILYFILWVFYLFKFFNFIERITKVNEFLIFIFCTFILTYSIANPKIHYALSENRLTFFVITLIIASFLKFKVTLKNILNFKNIYSLIVPLAVTIIVYGTDTGSFNWISMFILPLVLFQIFLWFKLFPFRKFKQMLITYSIFILVFLWSTLYYGYNHPVRTANLNNCKISMNLAQPYGQIYVDSITYYQVKTFKHELKNSGWNLTNPIIDLSWWGLKSGIITNNIFSQTTMLTVFGGPTATDVAIYNIEKRNALGNFNIYKTWFIIPIDNKIWYRKEPLEVFRYIKSKYHLHLEKKFYLDGFLVLGPKTNYTPN